MSKVIVITLIAALLLVGIWLAYLYLPYFHHGNNNSNTNLNNSVSEEYVEYNSSYGKVCPTGIKFLESKSSTKVECECPAGYEWDKEMIGGETGENCYGAGTECPIFSAMCVKK